MNMVYRRIVRPLLFAQKPEVVHERTLRGLACVGRFGMLRRLTSTLCRGPSVPVERFGLQFPNPIGLAAGMDKEAAALPAWEALGFGFTELGAVTWHAQPGNPAPRVFRAIPEEAIINRMGFNNPGAQAVAQVLCKWRRRGQWPKHPVGMNLGKSKITPLAEAPDDYAKSFECLWPHVDFFVVNVSSPNTPQLRELQDRSALDEILGALQDVNQRLAGQRGRGTPTPVSGLRPVLVKVAPDLSFSALDEILELVESRRVSGIVATNTTLSRPPATSPPVQRVYAEAGGLSGRPLAERSTAFIRHIFRQTEGRLPIVGVGGIFDVEDAWQKLLAGASLLQVYTGLVYEGPMLPKRLVHGLNHRLRERGWTFAEAVGRQA